MADKDPLILDFRNGRVLDAADLDEYYLGGPDNESAYWDDIDLEDAFDLPPVLPPVRLPEEAELAGQARRSALLADLRALADEVRATTVQTGAVNPFLIRLAEEAELVERDDEGLAPGEDAGWLDDLADDGDALDAWEGAFAMVLDTTPVLSAPDEMTADDLVLVCMHGSEGDLEAELASWTDSRGEEQAARELLALAAGEGAAVRTAAVTIVSRLGQAAEPAWREALDRAELRCYAKPQLVMLTGLDPEGTDLPAELQPERADLAWLIADTFGPFCRFDLGGERFPFDFAELQRVSGFEKPDEVFEAIARLDHPDAEAVLAMIGKHAGDKATAKAARRAAYKASTRRAARR